MRGLFSQASLRFFWRCVLARGSVFGVICVRPSLVAFFAGRATVLLVFASGFLLVLLRVAFVRISTLAVSARLVLIVPTL